MKHTSDGEDCLTDSLFAMIVMVVLCNIRMSHVVGTKVGGT